MSRTESLNPAQRAGVEHRGGSLLLLAGAGTGKTRVITHRVAALIDEGVPPWRILAVTFTNKAAHEMRERIAGLLGVGLDELRRDGPWIGTFHSICARILRRNGEGVGLSRNFAIYDADDQKSLMRKVLKVLDIDPKAFSPSAALGKIDAAKNLGWGRDRLEDLGYNEPILSWTRRAWQLYEDQLRAADAVDFGDLLTLTVKLLRNAGAPPSYVPAQASAATTPSRTVKLHTEREPAPAQPTKVDPVVGLRRRFFHIVVDEYQDTNPVQAEFVDLLCSQHSQLCVVGDDDQSIYGWRGADVKQILRFPDVHVGCEIIRLEQNYRSTQLILDCANAVIRDGPRRHDKQLWSELGPGEHVELHGFADEREEARFIARTIQVAIDDGESPSEIAVFYRTHAQSRPLEEAMRLYGVRYRMLGGIRFYDRREIKDLVGYLRLMTNPGSDLDCLRVINVPPRRIGSKTIERLASWAARNEKSFYEATGPASQYGEDAGLGKAARRAVQEFHDVVEQLKIDANNLTHDQIASLVVERTGYVESLEQEPDGETRIENLEEFIGSLEQFVTEQPEASLAEYLEQISLASSGDDESTDSAITLMTIHSAKGLEFDRVMLTGMEEGVFPHMRAIRALREEGDPDQLEEERRLAYVALTRARRKLAITYVESRFLWGESKQNPPSQFLRSLPDEAISRQGLATARRRRLAPRAAVAPRKREPQWNDSIVLEPEYSGQQVLGRRPAAASDERDFGDSEYVEYDDVEWRKGMQVRHPKFGIGTVLSWTGAGDQMKLTLVFGAARKTIMARFCQPL